MKHPHKSLASMILKEIEFGTPLKILGAIALFLFITLIRPSFADTATFSNHFAKLTSSFNNGKISDVIIHGKAAIASSKQESSYTRLDLADRLASMCLRAYNINCALEFGEVFDQEFKSLSDGTENNTTKLWGSIRGLTRLAKIAAYFGKNEKANQLCGDLAEIIKQTPADDTRAFLEAHLVIASCRIKTKDYQAAYLHIEAGWIQFLSINNPSDETLLEYIPVFISLFDQTGHTKKAISINNIALPFYAKRGSRSGYDLLRGGLALHSINVKSNNHQAAVLSAATVLMLIDQLEISDWTRSYFRNVIKALITIDCSIRTQPECSKVNHYVAEISNTLKDPTATNTYPLEDQGAMAIAVAIHELSLGGNLEAHIKNTLERVGTESKESENSVGKIALFFLSRANNDHENAISHIRTATLDQLNKIREEKKRTLFEITSIDNYQRMIFAYFTNETLVQTKVSSEDQRLVFEVSDLDNQSTRNIEAQNLLLSSTLDDRAEIASLQAYHRLRQDLDTAQNRIFSSQLEIQLKGHHFPKTKKVVNPAIPYQFQRQYDNLERLTSVIDKVRLRYNPNAWGLDEIQKILSPQERFISHQVVGSLIVTICVSSKNVFIQSSVVDYEQLNNSIKIIQSSLTNPSAPSTEIDSFFPIKESSYLTKIFLSPVRECLVGSKHLITSFNPGLSGVPTHVLLDPQVPYLKHNADDIDFSKVPWLGVRYSLSSLPSYTHLIASRSKKEISLATRSFVGFGDPKLTGLTNNGEQRGKAVLRGVTNKGASPIEELDELPDTSIELKAVFQKFGPSSKVYLRDSATEAAVRREILRDFKVIAFATHGLVREEIEGISEPALVFTPVDSSVPANDGLLTATDISRLDLSAKLVILSACNSGKFELSVFSSELGGLSTAFLLGGAKTTLASLWSVNSEATSVLMQRFSNEFSTGSISSSEALQKAILWMLSSSDSPKVFRNPRYWAAFSIFGDGGVQLNDSARKPPLAIQSVETFGKDPGHIQDSLTVGKFIALAGAVPNESPSEPYVGYLKVVDAKGVLQKEIRDTTRFFKLAKTYSENSMLVIAQPSDFKSDKSYEVQYRTKALELIDFWTFPRKRGEVISSILALKSENRLLIIASNLSKPAGDSYFQLTIVDTKKRRIIHSRELVLSGGTHNGIKALTLKDGTIKIYSSYLSSFDNQQKPTESPPSFFGLPGFCIFGYKSTVVSLSQSLQEIGKPLILPDVAIRLIATVDEGLPIALLTRYRKCSQNTLETVVARLSQTSLGSEKKLNFGGIESWSIGLIVRADTFVLISGAERYFEEGNFEKTGEKSVVDYLDPLKSHDSGVQSGILVAEMDKDFNLLRSDVLFTALDVFVDSVAEIDGALLLYGTAGDRQFGAKVDLKN